MKALLYGILAWALVGFMPVGASLADYTACWTPPTENTDGTPLTDLDGYRFWAIPTANTYGNPMVLPVTPASSCVPDQQESCHFQKPTGEMCYFKYWPSPAGDWKMKMQAFNQAGVNSADSEEVLFTLANLDGTGNPEVVKIDAPNWLSLSMECPTCEPGAGGVRGNELNVTRKGYFVIEGPDGQLLLNENQATRQVTSKDEAYEYITKDGRSGKFTILPPTYEVDWQ